jgi:hypothetical protein
MHRGVKNSGSLNKAGKIRPAKKTWSDLDTVAVFTVLPTFDTVAVFTVLDGAATESPKGKRMILGDRW